MGTLLRVSGSTSHILLILAVVCRRGECECWGLRCERGERVVSRGTQRHPPSPTPERDGCSVHFPKSPPISGRAASSAAHVDVTAIIFASKAFCVPYRGTRSVFQEFQETERASKSTTSQTPATKHASHKATMPVNNSFIDGNHRRLCYKAIRHATFPFFFTSPLPSDQPSVRGLLRLNLDT